MSHKGNSRLGEDCTLDIIVVPVSMKRQRFKMCFRLSEPHKCLNHWYLQCLVMIFFSHHLPWSPVLIFLESNVCGIYP